MPLPMNEEKHWNNIAPTYNAEIFDVFQSDTKRILLKYFKKHANPEHHAIDFGCGNGKAFSYLAPRFKTILGVDISKKLLNQARALPYKNVRLQYADLTKQFRVAKADFVFCCNVAILSDVETNLSIIKNIQRALKPGRGALVVIPSLESMLYSAWRLIDWYKKERVNPEDIDPSEYSGLAGKKTEIIQGLVSIDGRITKHYTQQEIEVIFPRCGLAVSKIERVEYAWNSEFAKPPKWMHGPYPWDWLVECSNPSK
jgi:SAM-dependent methyltransferase